MASTLIPYYSALALQHRCVAINQCADRSEAHRAMEQAVESLYPQIFAAKKFIGDHLKLVVLPEYFMSGFPMRESLTEWRDKAALHQSDPIFTRLGEMCKKMGIYLSGNYYEKEDHFTNLFFQASFIIDDKGDLILNYRRLNSMYSPTPHDVLEKYTEVYEYESLFPVVDTPLGKLACIASEEILYPEVARCLMMRGAEIFLHSSSEIGSPQLTRKNIAKYARAIENMAYVVSANSAGIADIPILEHSTDGGSKIINYEGICLAEASPGESIVANANIHLQSLRNHRGTVSMKNYNARQRFELYADSYKNYSHYPANSFLGGDVPEKQAFKDIQERVIRRLSGLVG